MVWGPHSCTETECAEFTGAVEVKAPENNCVCYLGEHVHTFLRVIYLGMELLSQSMNILTSVDTTKVSS